MANPKFTLGGDTFTFSRPKLYPVDEPQALTVAVDYSEGGKLYAYNKGISVKTWRLSFQGLNATDNANVEDWVANHAVGPVNTFTYTDENNTTHTVRMMDTENPLRETSKGVFAGTITLREEI